MAQIRIGQGFDVHKFGGEGPIILGGVPIPYEFGFIAHSDGDVVLHALTDAILGALALGDIGTHFSDKSDEFKGIDSRILLKKSYEMVLAKGFQLVNADMTIIAQAPLMRDHIPQMRINIAETLGVHFEQISVKATTTERLGFTGRKEGIAAEAIVLLEQMTRS